MIIFKNFLLLFLLFMIFISWTGCSLKTKNSHIIHKIDGKKENNSEKIKNRQLLSASLYLTTQGKNLIDNKKTDQAITLLERAIEIDPSNGQNYFYLARAWIIKKKYSLASEFNDLSRIYLKSNPKWADKIKKQKRKIERLKNI